MFFLKNIRVICEIRGSVYSLIVNSIIQLMLFAPTYCDVAQWRYA